MRLVRHAVAKPEGATCVPVSAERMQLAKTRWRGVAADGTEFGFELPHPLRHGDCILVESGIAYCIEQQPEPALEIALPRDPQDAARLAWALGNLHQPIQIEPDVMRLADDSAARQLLDQMGVGYRVIRAIFIPFRAAAPHHHGH